ncbi:hypothetical protein PR202_ga14304 [Eleusine coracana subsp. coracana]|uniref:Uncharacterized protein n=1 Tax=Eleusine coracana subsp. coracana TaxID=191504 RepID=A0AAV5CH50_ELECO|nr:hypothetical protein QOZ80_6BG0505050 [Eleusine coracana subsp. coracana]GJM97381.1 hypothetical protein PR202_ga14304 [Eleusine coracana subsp. coracana]
MEPSDLNTHLPPRKRLLAGLRTAASALDADPPPSPPAATDLAARLREMAIAANASSSSPEEMIEAARAAATAAADAAAAARAAAAEKAAVAAKARAAARAAMEFLDSFSRSGSSRNNNGLQLKVRSRKKHVQVKLLYKPNGRVEGRGAVLDAPPNKPRRRREPDQDVARTLHRAVNSSPRISPAGPKRPRSTPRDEADASNVSSSAHAPTQVAELPNGRKSGDTTVPLFKHEVPDDGAENSSKNATKSSDNGDAVGSLNAARKVKIKRKELLLNQNTNTSKETQPVVPGESKSNGNGVEKCVNPADTKAPVDGLAPLKITSIWKFKKFKTSHCSSDSKVLHNVCSSPSAAETSASVKAD